MTSWDNVYRQLKNALPDNLYHNRKKLTRLKQDKDYVIAEFEDGQIEKCDLLVGADGSGSNVRQQLLPEVISKYAGYVAWRWVLDESKVPI
jgi:2-polyprenyl-6-methoxyphenol hydroxylase-like FAD-dependent oxidoreductase